MIDWKRLYLNLEISKPGSWRSLGRTLNIPPATFTRLKAGHSVNAQHMVSLLEFLQKGPAQFYMKTNGKRTSR